MLVLKLYRKTELTRRSCNGTGRHYNNTTLHITFTRTEVKHIPKDCTLMHFN